MDLDSPFLKTALVQGSTGVVEEREVKSAKVLGEQIELTTTKGGIALFPKNEVLGLLPKFPESGIVYRLEDVDKAIRLLESAPEDVKQKADASAATIQKWKDLRKPVEEAEKRRKQEEADAVAQKAIEEKKAAEEIVKAELDRLAFWLKEAADFQKPRSEEELEELRVEGQGFLRNKTGDSGKVYDCLAVLSQVIPKEKGGPLPDLVKLSEVQPKIVPDDLLVWVTSGILIVSFFGLLMGLSFISSVVTRLRERAVLGGVVFGGLGLVILAGLAAIWWPISGDGESVSLIVAPGLEGTITFARNSVKPVYYLPSSESRASGLEFASTLLASLPPSDESSGMLKGKLKQGALWVEAEKWTWKQPVTALGIPIPVSFIFEGKIPQASGWADVVIEKVSLGRVTFPESLGSIFCDGMKSTIQSGLSSGGFASIKVTQMDDGQLLILTQAFGTKPKVEVKEEVKEEVKGEVKEEKAIKALYRKMITAEDLAKVIVSGGAKEYLNKFVIIEGEVHSVGRSNFTSTGKMGRDRVDDIYLIGIRNFYGPKPEDHLLVRCQIKTDCVFQMDSRGDLYARYVIQDFDQEKQMEKMKFKTIDDREVSSLDIDTSKEQPLIQRGKFLTFRQPLRVELNQKEIEEGKALGGKTGRPVGSAQSGEIELYGITLRAGEKLDAILFESDGTILKAD